jgi:hypothetical protein
MADARARHDLRAARALAALPEPILDVAIYPCQQTAEKAIKAYLIWRDDPFPKIHDLGVLLARAAVWEKRFQGGKMPRKFSPRTFPLAGIPATARKSHPTRMNSPKPCNTPAPSLISSSNCFRPPCGCEKTGA